MSEAFLSTVVDLSRLPPPTIVAPIAFETILAEQLADLIARAPAFSALVESDPAYKVLEVTAYREQLLRQRFDDAARQVMVAFATGSNLDQLGALVGVARLLVDPADPIAGTPAAYEGDAAFRQRIVLAPESFSVAGPEGAYIFFARTADGDVLDASATSPSPGEVVVTVLSRVGNGTASPELLAAVTAIVSGQPVRPLTDHVTVQSAAIVPFSIAATLWTFAGPDTSIVLAAADARLDAYLDSCRRLGRDITDSGIKAALHAEGVQRVALTGWADVVLNPTQAGHCTGVTIAFGGYAS